MANYEVDSEKLKPYLPYKTEFELWNSTCFVSLVGFMFLNTKVMGVKIPFHINFEEVNLRFYVRYNENNIWKRGVVFIKEIVPKPALTFVANALYNENYETLYMLHNWEINSENLFVEYKWKKNKKWNSISVQTGKQLIEIAEGSQEKFITDHYWGYAKINDKKTSEYGVEHPEWQVYKTIDYFIDTNFDDVYGKEFSFLTNKKPESVFLAEGSEIKVKSGRTL